MIPDERIRGAPPYMLYTAIEQGVKLEELLTKGRILVYTYHDREAPEGEHMHMHRKVLRSYNPQTRTVVLSKEGSRRILGNLDVPEKEFSFEELAEMSNINGCSVRPANWEIF